MVEKKQGSFKIVVLGEGKSTSKFRYCTLYIDLIIFTYSSTKLITRDIIILVYTIMKIEETDEL